MDLIVQRLDSELSRKRVSSTPAGGARGDVLLGADWGLAPLGSSLLVGFPDIGAVGVLPPFLAEGSCRASDRRFLTFIPDVTVNRQPRLQITPCPDTQQVLFTGPADFGRILMGWETEQGWDLWAAAPAEGLDRGAIYLFVDAGRRPGARRNHDAADVVLEGPSPGDRLGTTLARCPDPHGEGDLLAVGLPGWSGFPDEERVSQRGAVALFRPDQLDPGRWSLDDALALVEGDHPYDRAGLGLACGGDLTGDGWPDLVVGAPGSSRGVDRGGAVHILGRELPARSRVSEIATTSILGSTVGEQLGRSVEVADLDLDSRSDLIVGAPGLSTDDAPGAGGVHIFLHADLDQTASSTLHGVDNVAPERPARFGTILAIADLSGNGAPEVLTGAWRMTGSGRAFAGEIRAWNLDQSPDPPWEIFVLTGDGAHQQLGRRLVAADVLEEGSAQIISTIRRRAR